MGKVLSIGILIVLLTVASAAAVSVENLTRLNITQADLWDIVLSPDGKQLAYVAYDSAYNQQIFEINTDGTGVKKITNDTLKKWGLAWGPDKIAYTSFGKDGLEKIFIINPDGTDNKQLILDNTRQGNAAEDKPPVWSGPSWSPDGKSLVYTSLDEKMDPKLYMVNADGTGKRPVFNDTFKQWSPSISPDGKNIVYVSYNNIFKEELFIVDIAGTSRRQLTFDEIKKNYPVWGPDGAIAYVSYENVTSSGEKIFAINQDGTDRRLFVDGDYKQRSPTFSLDGSRFAYAAIDSAGKVKIAVGDVAGVTPTATAEKTPAGTTPAEVTSTPTAVKTTHAAPTATETPEGMGGSLWTMFLILAVIVIVLLALLLITNVFSKK
ncbi:MAG: hypothetical protein OIN66_02810 [Candidatus Methanoperedens sp.]|nr:hypothetical protein [Candidatus Methanoperedens sp.]